MTLVYIPVAHAGNCYECEWRCSQSFIQQSRFEILTSRDSRLANWFWHNINLWLPCVNSFPITVWNLLVISTHVNNRLRITMLWKLNITSIYHPSTLWSLFLVFLPWSLRNSQISCLIQKHALAPVYTHAKLVTEPTRVLASIAQIGH